MTIRASVHDLPPEGNDILVPISRSEINTVIAALKQHRTRKQKDIRRRKPGFDPFCYGDVDVDQRHIDQGGAVLGRIFNLLGDTTSSIDTSEEG